MKKRRVIDLYTYVRHRPGDVRAFVGYGAGIRYPDSIEFDGLGIEDLPGVARWLAWLPPPERPGQLRTSW